MTDEEKRQAILDLALAIVEASINVAKENGFDDGALPQAMMVASVAIAKRRYGVPREVIDSMVSSAWDFVPSTDDRPFGKEGP